MSFNPPPVPPSQPPHQPPYQPPYRPSQQPPPPMPPVPAGSWGASPAPYGPPGQPRGIGISILLAIVTLGIYTYVWTWKTHDEIKRSSDVGVGGAIGFVIYLLVSPVTFFLLPAEISQMMQRYNQPSRVSAITGLWILLPLAGPIVWFVKVQGQLNDHWRALGAP